MGGGSCFRVAFRLVDQVARTYSLKEGDILIWGTWSQFSDSGLDSPARTPGADFNQLFVLFLEA